MQLQFRMCSSIAGRFRKSVVFAKKNLHELNFKQRMGLSRTISLIAQERENRHLLTEHGDRVCKYESRIEIFPSIFFSAFLLSEGLYVLLDPLALQ
jgi:hypothetical protein